MSFKKFLQGRPTFNGNPYEYVEISNFLEFLFFKLQVSKVDESYYHQLCKNNEKNRSVKMSLFSHIGIENKNKLKFYVSSNELFILQGHTGVSVELHHS